MFQELFEKTCIIALLFFKSFFSLILNKNAKLDNQYKCYIAFPMHSCKALLKKYALQSLKFLKVLNCNSAVVILQVHATCECFALSLLQSGRLSDKTKEHRTNLAAPLEKFLVNRQYLPKIVLNLDENSNKNACTAKLKQSCIIQINYKLK